MTDQTIDIATWPARLAVLVTQARESLRNPEGVLETPKFVDQQVREYGLGRDVQEAWRDQRNRLRIGELVYLSMSALRDMEVRGEVWPCGSAFAGTGVLELLGILGNGLANTAEPSVASVYRPTVRLLSLDVTSWSGGGVVELNIRELADQALMAHRAGLDVAAAVTARVAVEEAVEQFLRDLGCDHATRMAWEREEDIFDSLTLTAQGCSSRWTRRRTRGPICGKESRQ